MMDLPISINRKCGECKPDCPSCLFVVEWHWVGAAYEQQQEGYKLPSLGESRALQLLRSGAVVRIRICT